MFIHFTKQNDSCAGGSGEHAEHHEKLFLAVCGKEFFGHKVIVNKGGEKTYNSHDKQNDPVAFNDLQTDCSNTLYYHDIEENVAESGHKKVVDIGSVDDVATLQRVDQDFHQCSH